MGNVIPVQSVNPPLYNPASTSPVKPRSQSYFHKVTRSAAEAVTATANAIAHCVVKVFDGLGKIREDGSAFVKAFKIVDFAALGIIALGSQMIGLPILKLKASIALNVADCFQFFGDIDYFVKGNYKNDRGSVNKLSLVGNILVTLADFGGVVLWLNELKIIQLAKWGASLGKQAIFSPLVRFGLTRILGVVGGAGFVFLGADAVYRMATAKNKYQFGKACFDLAWSVSEIALRVFILAGCTNVPGLVTLGILAAGTGIAAFLYGYYYKKQLEAKELEAKKVEKTSPETPLPVNT